MLSVAGLDLEIGALRICTSLHFSLQAGQSLAILGRNGVGKSTLLATLAGLRHCDGDAITLDDTPLAAFSPRELALRRGFCPQHPQDSFESSVRETALIGRHPHLGRWAFEGEDDLARVEAALAATGLTDIADREVHALSGGERQRLALATLLVQDPQWLLLDEPLAHLDLHHALDMLKLLATQCGQGKGVVAVLHDPNLAYRHFDQSLLLLGNGEWCCGPTRELLTVATLERLYAQPMQSLDHQGLPWFVPELQ